MYGPKEELAIVVVDMFEDWENDLKGRERGFTMEQDDCNGWRWVSDEKVGGHYQLHYEYGSARAGWDAIADTVRLAHEYGHPVYGVCTDDYQDSEGMEMCPAIKPYIPAERQFVKRGYSALGEYCTLGARLAHDERKKLFVVGYDRDCCVLQTVIDGIKNGFEMITAECCMVTRLKAENAVVRQTSMQTYRGKTRHLETLSQVWNLLRDNRLRSH